MCPCIDAAWSEWLRHTISEYVCLTVLVLLYITERRGLAKINQHLKDALNLNSDKETNR